MPKKRPGRAVPTRKKPVAKKAAPPPVTPLQQPEARREWERGTTLVSLFVATGSFFEHRANAKTEGKTPRVKPANLLLVSEPGRGKTELLDRFRPNTNLEFRSDLTVRGLWRLLDRARDGFCSHIGATEFQKFFQRRASTAEQMLGTLVQAMEEGVDKIDVGSKQIRMSPPARIGLIGAITHGTLDKKQEYLGELGFLSRTAVIPWELPLEEMKEIMCRISDGTTDLQPVRLVLPDRAVAVAVPPDISHRVQKYVLQYWKHESLRVFTRFRTILMASAVLDARTEVTKRDEEVLHDFDVYWRRMITE